MLRYGGSAAGGAQRPRKVNELWPTFNMRLHKGLRAPADISNSGCSSGREARSALKLRPLVAHLTCWAVGGSPGFFGQVILRSR